MKNVKSIIENELQDYYAGLALDVEEAVESFFCGTLSDEEFLDLSNAAWKAVLKAYLGYYDY